MHRCCMITDGKFTAPQIKETVHHCKLGYEPNACHILHFCQTFGWSYPMNPNSSHTQLATIELKYGTQQDSLMLVAQFCHPTKQAVDAQLPFDQIFLDDFIL